MSIVYNYISIIILIFYKLLTEALSLLEPLTDDPVNYVRQGAFIAVAMILIEQTEALQPKVKTYREMFKKTIEDKHEDAITKFGAILATGIIDAGGIKFINFLKK